MGRKKDPIRKRALNLYLTDPQIEWLEKEAFADGIKRSAYVANLFNNLMQAKKPSSREIS